MNNYNEPGIEMDALVARRIFGWTEEKTATNKWFDPFVKLWRPTPKDNPATPAWSRAPSHALTVIEKLTEIGIPSDIRVLEPNLYEVKIGYGLPRAQSVDSFATAICRAALMAVAS